MCGGGGIRLVLNPELGLPGPKRENFPTEVTARQMERQKGEKKVYTYVACITEGFKASQKLWTGREGDRVSRGALRLEVVVVGGPLRRTLSARV